MPNNAKLTPLVVEQERMNMAFMRKNKAKLTTLVLVALVGRE